MNIEELKNFLDKYNITYKGKENAKGSLFELEECPFCDKTHSDKAIIIHYKDNGNVVGKCPNTKCSSESFSKLYSKLTGKNCQVKKKSKDKKKVNALEDDIELIDQLVEGGNLDIKLDKYGNTLLRVDTLDGKAKRTISLTDDSLEMYLQNIALQKRDYFFDKDRYDHMITYINILAHQKNDVVPVYNRIYNDGIKIIYELDPATNMCVVIEKDSELISITDDVNVFFHHSQYYRSQIEPDMDYLNEYKQLPKLIKKHFNLTHRDDVMLFSIYLVSCFLGTYINHPLLAISGQKGSGKSSFIKKFCDLVDPKHIELGSVPRNREDLSLKISESYVTEFDNMSYLNKDISDMLCRAVTGGVDTRRTLYMDKQQTVFDLKSVVVMDGIQFVIKEDDLLDRTISLTLSRFKSDELKTEEELRHEFEEDKPKILMCCFLILSLALDDEESVDRSKTTRMADFYVWAVKIGKAMGYKEERIVNVLEKNRKEANYETLMNDVTAQALLNYMEYKDKVEMTVTSLHKDLKAVAEELCLDLSCFPKQPNTLSRKLNSIQSNLEEEGINYLIKNKGYAKEITITNAKPKHEPITIGT